MQVRPGNGAPSDPLRESAGSKIAGLDSIIRQDWASWGGVSGLMKIDDIKSLIKHLLTFHRQGTQPNIFIFSTPRSGTTWLAELLATQGSFKIVNEPCNLRVPVVRETLGLHKWESIFFPENRPRLRAYLQSFVDAKDTDLRFKRETPFTEFWHLKTDRVLFKILFAGEDCIDWFRTEFNAHVVFLIRHPIPVSRSRKSLPRLESFLAPPFCRFFSDAQLAFAKEILNSDNFFQKAVLDWCLQNAIPLRHARPEWIVLTYEQLVVEPEVVISYLAKSLGLQRPELMRQRLLKASRSTGKSSVESQALLADPAQSRAHRQRLVERWREKITFEEESAAMRILKTFGIDVYELGRSMPVEKYLLPSSAGTPRESRHCARD
jgi:hypothetical protein